MLASRRADFKAFSQTRFSIRDFSEKAVAIGLIEDAIRVAQKTPSVCNRQTSRVHVVRGAKKKRLLECQNGNRGFGDLADTVLVVSSDLCSFCGVQERNQAFIDGGMFAMSLLLGLHYVGLGACALNWSVDREADQRLREFFSIEDSECIVLLIAVGHLPEQFSVARSARKELEAIMRVHE